MKKKGGSGKRAAGLGGRRRVALARSSGAAGHSKANDTVELLLERMLESKTGTATGMHTLLYCTTASMQRIAYRYGFSIGRLMHHKHRTLEKLFDALERGGMGKVLYTPAMDVSYITSQAHAIGNYAKDLKSPVHHYEAGMIAGFLSSYTGNRISTVETSCAWRGGLCTFVSRSSVAPLDRYTGSDEGIITNVIDSIAGMNSTARYIDYYTYLSVQPLLSKGIVSRLSEFMLLCGKRLGEGTNAGDLEAVVHRIGTFIGTDAKLLKNTKAKKSIAVRYNSFSSAGYVDLTAPLFMGLVGKGSRVGAYSRISKGAYLVYIDFKQK